MNAEHARAISDFASKCNTASIDSHIEGMLRYVEEEAREGKTSATFVILTDAGGDGYILRRFRQLGFRVEVTQERGEQCPIFTVSW